MVKKILIIHNRYKKYGGEDTVVEQEYNAYQKLGYDVLLYQESNSNLKISDLLFSVFNFKSHYKLKKKITEFSPDIIHVHNFIFKFSPSIFWVIPKGVNVFLTIHNYRFLCPSGTLFSGKNINLDSKTTLGLIKNIFRGVYQSSSYKTLILTLVFRINKAIGSFNRVDKYIFLTEFAKEIHHEWMPKTFIKSIVKPNFLLNESNNAPVNIKTIDLIFVGRFSIEKGILDVLPILMKLNNLSIHLIGGGELHEEIEKKCKEVKHIVLHGEKTRDEAVRLMNKSKALIFPSVWYEGMPMTIIESYSQGTPVISREIGAMKYMISNKKTGFFYNNLNDLEEVLLSIDKMENIRENCKREFINKYSKKAGLLNLSELIYLD